MLGIDGIGEEGGRTGTVGVRRGVGVAAGGVKDDGYGVVLRLRADGAANLETVDVPETNVEENGIGMRVVEDLEGLAPGVGVGNFETGGGKKFAQRVAMDFVIVHAKHPILASRHAMESLCNAAALHFSLLRHAREGSDAEWRLARVDIVNRSELLQEL